MGKKVENVEDFPFFLVESIPTVYTKSQNIENIAIIESSNSRKWMDVGYLSINDER